MNVKWARWTAIAKRIKAGAIGAEIGTHAGQMSRALFTLIPKLRLIMVDRWIPYSDAERKEFPRSKIVQIDDPGKWNDLRDKVLELAAMHPGSRVICGDSVDAADDIEDGSLDFVFIDSDHTYSGAVRELAAWMPKVKPGGYVMGYDYGDDRDASVTRAVKELGIPVVREKNKLWAVRL